MSAPLLEVRGLAVSHGEVPALAGVDLDVAPGEVVALLGANGAGKSTLLRAVMGLVRPRAGVVRLAGRDVTEDSPERRARAGIGYVPEGRRVFPGMTVADNIRVACRAGRRERADRLARAYALFPALARRRHAVGWQLSGGEQQMLAIARALAAEPRLLLLDEPSLGLAPALIVEVLARVREIARAGTAVLLAEQNAARALEVADRATVLRLGRAVAAGPAAELADDPAVRAAFLGGG